MKRSVVSAVVLATGLLSMSNVVQASPPFELMGGALSSGGLNARSTGADAASTYFNPARLSRARPGLQLGWFVLNDGIDITLFGRNPANDVPVSALDQFEGRFPPVPTTWLQNGCDPGMGGRWSSSTREPASRGARRPSRSSRRAGGRRSCAGSCACPATSSPSILC